jgi:hypothetical protein
MVKKIFNSGGAGFLGPHLCERLLANGHEVTYHSVPFKALGMFRPLLNPALTSAPC